MINKKKALKYVRPDKGINHSRNTLRWGTGWSRGMGSEEVVKGVVIAQKQALRFQSVGAAWLTGDDLDQSKPQVQMSLDSILKERGQAQSPSRPKPLDFAEL